jgi:GT2 family glycosyltransferase
MNNMKRGASGMEKTKTRQKRPKTEDTIISLSPAKEPFMLRNSTQDIIAGLKIDHIEIVSGKLLITGWAFGHERLDVTLAGQMQPSTRKSLARSDVQRLNVNMVPANAGFQIAVELEENGVYGLEWNIRREGNDKLVRLGLDLDWNMLSPVAGNLDAVSDALMVTGWAVGSGGNTAKVEILVNGETLTKVPANLPRSDFINDKGHVFCSGFKYQIPTRALTTTNLDITARVEDVVLDGSPLKHDLADKIQLRIEGIKHGQLKASLHGWPGKPLSAQLYIDGQVQTRLHFKRSKAQTGLNPVLEADYALPAQLLDAKPHSYFLVLDQASQWLQSDPQTIIYPDFRLNIDFASLEVLSGWCYRADQSAPLNIRALFEDEQELRIQTRLERLDVQAADPNAPSNCGFSIRIPLSTKPGYSLSLIDDETGVLISRSYVASRYALLCRDAHAKAMSNQPADRLQVQALASSLSQQTAQDLVIRTDFLPRPAVNPAHPEVAVIIPVYEGLEATIECIESVLAADNTTPTQYIIVNDYSPNVGIKAYLNSLRKRSLYNLLIIERHSNGGFSQAVNLGMLVAGDRDVILLNADTVVQSGWVDRLRHSAQMDERTATVTPFSNNAEICTLPYICKSLPVDDPAFATAVDQLASQVNAGKLVELPVAIGFCVYIKQNCIRDIGLFDAASWGRGYGEEVDFCLQASSKGWRHVMTTDTFVVHRGNVSFGDEKIHRVQESAKKISEKYPFYEALIQRFLTIDPVAPARRDLNLSIIAKVLPIPRILHVSHAYGGGTEQYVKDQCALNQEDGVTPIVVKFDDQGGAILTINLQDTELIGFFASIHQETYRKDELDALKANLQYMGFDRMHLHSPFGIPLAFLHWMVDSYKYQITIHDYAWICPRVTLTQTAGRYCEEPPIEACNQCVRYHSPHPGLEHFLDNTNPDVADYRKGMNAILAKAEIVYAGAQDVVDRMNRHGITANYKAVPHPHPKDSVFLKKVTLPPRQDRDGNIRVALIGAISEIKGYHQLVECAEEAQKKRLPIEFIVFGITHDNERLSRYNNVRILGAYQDEELEDLMFQWRPDVAFFPNQWPETYSYTLSHALRFGLFTIVSNIGAPIERISKLTINACITSSMNAADTLNKILELKGHRQQLNSVSSKD